MIDGLKATVSRRYNDPEPINTRAGAAATGALKGTGKPGKNSKGLARTKEFRGTYFAYN